MHPTNVTTPFGRRGVSLAVVQRQLDVKAIAAGKSVDKWRVFRDIAEARPVLGLQDRSLAVLNALLSFHPETELVEGEPLVVFPSNVQLSLRAHGIADATLRRHLACLVEAGLILRRDSANGKRFARKSSEGRVEDAFGFDLSPLLLRAEEFAVTAQTVVAERVELRRLREQVTIGRRDIRKLISAALEEGSPGDWVALEEEYIQLIATFPKVWTLEIARRTVAALGQLQTRVLNHLESRQKSENMNGNADQNERHIQNSNTKPPNELEPCFRKDGDDGSSTKQRLDDKPAFPLGLVLRACPEISAYGPKGLVESWKDLMAAAVVVRSMLGVSPSAYQTACEVLGPENAAITIACILERAQHINSAGGYLRNLVERAKRGEFSIGPMVMALVRTNGQMSSQTG
ncbi:plasmid replication protein RepC [Rhizobium helianthi]|uniref:Plasmid replication protein RepC n=1 Tax=Rhizobium helianthi TaxID=1132695 RepID=A0ABW4MA49_9HYPH